MLYYCIKEILDTGHLTMICALRVQVYIDITYFILYNITVLYELTVVKAADSNSAASDPAFSNYRENNSNLNVLRLET